MASSKEFRQTFRTVSRNFHKYTDAMERDVQVLITSMLDVIEAKIVALRKLLKLKLCIKNVKNVAELRNLEETFTITDNKRPNDSLDDLSSIVYEVEKHSLPAEDESIEDIRSLCSALNNKHDDAKTILDKYIYLMLKKGHESKLPDDYGDVANKPEVKKRESVVYLGKTEYESILDILNMVLRSYKMQETLDKRHKILEKIQTEPSIAARANCREQDRKIASDSICQQQQREMDRNRSRNKKSSCF